MPDREDNYNPLNDSKLLEDINNAFIKKFKTDNNFYIYDVNTNEFIKVDKVIWNIFPDEAGRREDYQALILKWGKENIQKSLKEIQEAILKQNLFKANRPIIGVPMRKDQLKKHIDGYNNQTCLNITDDCNFRCKYCTYSGIYPDHRTHSKKNMSWTTAKKALDDFIHNSRFVENPSLSFYGGEPLLAMDLIKKCVNYLKQKDKHCHYNLTTNGALLNGNNKQFFIDEGFNVTVSLNGPEDIHNAYRVFPNGKPSWQIIMKNLMGIKSKNEEYFIKHINFSCVFTPPYRLKEVILYFYESFPGMNVRFNNVDIYNTDYFYRNYSKLEMSSFSKQIRELLESYKELFINSYQYDNYLSLIETIVGNDILDLHKRNKEYLCDIVLSQGPCIIGERRLFVTTEGNYMPCERVHLFPFVGNINKGLNYNKIYNIMIQYNNVFSSICTNCPYVRLCYKCYKDIILNKGFNMHLAKELCNKKQLEVKNKISLYLYLVEQNKDAFKKMESIKLK